MQATSEALYTEASLEGWSNPVATKSANHLRAVPDAPGSKTARSEHPEPKESAQRPRPHLRRVPDAATSQGRKATRRSRNSLGVASSTLDAALASLANGLDAFVAGIIADRRDGSIVSRLDAELPLDLVALESAEILDELQRLAHRSGGHRFENITSANEHNFHVLAPAGDKLFMYVVVDRSKTTLAMVRHAVTQAAEAFGPGHE